jgi:nucleoside triphosphate pyrophosphatase
MLVLASASPRRQELLRNAGITFTVQPANVDETPLPRETPRECAERLARDKALAVWRDHPKELVLGADTVVVAGSEMLAKPVDADDAARMLRLLSGRTHEVITGVCLVKAALGSQYSAAPTTSGGDRNFELTVAAETTAVTMYEVSDQEILEYVATGEPMDKAGGYAIQGMASRWIPRIEGDYSNVVGLPVALLYRMLKETQLT